MAERDLGQDISRRKEEEERRAFLKQLKRGGLTPEESESMASEFAVSIPEKREAAKKERSEAERKARWGEFAEQLARSITQYAAAKHGSAIDAGKADWSDAQKRIAERYKQEAGDIDRREKQLIDVLGREDKDRDSKLLSKTGKVLKSDPSLEVWWDPSKGYIHPVTKKVIEATLLQDKPKELRAEVPKTANPDAKGFVTTRTGQEIKREYILPTGEIQDPQDLPSSSTKRVFKASDKYKAYQKEIRKNLADIEYGKSLLGRKTLRYADILDYMIAKQNDSGGRLSDQDIERSSLIKGIVEKLQKAYGAIDPESEIPVEARNAMEFLFEQQTKRAQSVIDDYADDLAQVVSRQTSANVGPDKRVTVTPQNAYIWITGKEPGAKESEGGTRRKVKSFEELD